MTYDHEGGLGILTKTENDPLDGPFYDVPESAVDQNLVRVTFLSS